MKISINHNIVPAFLVESRFRVCRHLVLLSVVLTIILSFIWYVPEVDNLPYRKLLGGFIYFLVFASEIYSNIYIAVPRLLFKGRFLAYILYILLLIVIFILTILFVNFCVLDIQKTEETRGLNVDVINLFSAAITLGLIFIGTTSFVLFKNWIRYNQKVSQLESETLQSELKMLKSQINPHFLFNMLNNANVLIKKDGEEASNVLFKFEDLLRYQLDDSVKDEVALTSEIHFLTDFLNLEKIRRDRFEYVISKEGDINKVKVPPLLFITFVENAVKHNPDSENLSYVYLSFKVRNDKLEFVCENSKPPVPIQNKAKGGLGLRNIKRRLELLYPQNYELDIIDEETKYTVKLYLSL